MDPRIVALAQADSGVYPTQPPFHPSEAYPEYPFAEVASKPNTAYAAVRESFRLLGLDAERYGRPDWNPLGDVIQAGDRVVLKPNMVRDKHDGGQDLHCILTHGSVVRAVLDYVHIALKGTGEIAVADAPQFDAHWEGVLAHSGIGEMVRYCAETLGIGVTLSDLRVEQAILERGLVVDRKRLAGDPKGYQVVSLGEGSAFSTLNGNENRLRGSDYDVEETITHHTGRTQEYYLGKTILDADVFINIPKMKTHRKTGVTLCMKNLIGINGDKNWIPHYRIGSPGGGGDEFPDTTWLRTVESQVKDKFKQAVYHMGPVTRALATRARDVQRAVLESTGLCAIRAGGWYGNDTLWRAIHDLNRVCLYADRDGRMRDTPQRRYMAVMDGIVAGEGTGPFENDPVALGAIVAGWHPVSVDIATVDLMDFDYRHLPVIAKARDAHRWSLWPCEADELEYRSNASEWGPALRAGTAAIRSFAPSLGWEDQLRRQVPHSV